MPMAVQNERPVGVRCDCRQNVRSIDECQANSVAQANRGERVLYNLVVQ
jgi:hypothetical protein